jgi:uncharacterized membrane protein YoaK (UPF0700 family)
MIALAITLTAVAGYVDAVGYLVLAHVLTANMSGNTVALGRAIVERDWAVLMRNGSAIALFVAGALISRITIDAARRRFVRSIDAFLFLTEAVLLGAFWVAGSAGAPFLPLLALASMAMGLQNATITKFGALTVRTTHVTGTVSEFAEKFAEVLVGRDGRNGKQAIELASLWLAYAVFAGLGAAAQLSWGLASLSVPIAIVMIVSIVLFARMQPV